MDEQVRQNIFVPFFTTKQNGTGIGLSLVRQIMRSHHGSVGVRSAPGAGTAVRLSPAHADFAAGLASRADPLLTREPNRA
jgi:nitrogen-specific signal transduction histidine kinase